MNTTVITSAPAPKEPQKEVVTFIFIFLIILLIAGCRGTQQLAVTERVTHDTCYISNMQYDSIYIDRFAQVQKVQGVPFDDAQGKRMVRVDTIIKELTKYEHKYKLLRDTIKVIRQDSIPYEVRVVETKVERYTPWYARALAFIGFLCLVWFIIKIVVRIKTGGRV